jgi:hypothetical protein
MTPNNVTSIQGPAVEDGMKGVFRLSGCVQTGKMGRKRSPSSGLGRLGMVSAGGEPVQVPNGGDGQPEEN